MKMFKELLLVYRPFQQNQFSSIVQNFSHKSENAPVKVFLALILIVVNLIQVK